MDWEPGKLIFQDKDDVLDYRWNFRDADSPFLQVGENVASYVVTVEAGLTLVSDSNDADSVTVWLTGGTPGRSYDVAVEMTTSQSRTVERSVRFMVQEN